MSTMLRRLPTIRFWLLMVLLCLAPMSLTPSLALPILQFSSFRIGLYQSLALLFIVLCLPLISANVQKLVKNRLFVVTLLSLAVVFLVSLCTTQVMMRTVLYTASVVGLLLLGLSAYLVWTQLPKKRTTQLMTALLWSGVIFGLLAVLQLIIASFDRTAFGTLCKGCSDAVFGFPRINLFAAEPQFLANSLLPALFAGFFFREKSRLANWTIIVTSLAIGLTLSRGAFLAVGVGLIAYMVIRVRLKHQSVKPILRLLSLSVLGCSLGFVLLVTSASIRYHSTPFITYNTTVSMIDQVTMGTIRIPQQTAPIVPTVPTTPTASETFTPEGFVVASSNERLDAAHIAVRAWLDSPKTILFGTGLGNLGTYINNHIPNQSVPIDLTVYIFYILILANLGLAGLISLCLPIFLALYQLGKNVKRSPHHAFMFCLLLAFTVHLWFFGSFINILYYPLWISIGLALTRSTHHSISNRS